MGSKITVDGDCSHEIRRLLLGRKTMTNLDNVLKSKGFTLPTKVHIVKVIVFGKVMTNINIILKSRDLTLLTKSV